MKACVVCGRKTQAGNRCFEHKRLEQNRRNQRVAEYGYSSANWQRVRTRRRILAAGLCELQLPGCTKTATHTHLDPAAKGDHRRATLDQARACCANCSGAIDAPRSIGGEGLSRMFAPAANPRQSSARKTGF